MNYQYHKLNYSNSINLNKKHYLNNFLMKTHYKNIIIILCSFLFNFCSSEEPFIPRFSVDFTADSFPAMGGSKSITLTSNISWSASSNVEWLSVSPTSGKESALLTLTASENNTPADRKGTVTLTPQTGDPIKINVSQPTDHQFSVDISEVVFESSPGEMTIHLTAKTSWQVSSGADWLKVNPGSGTGNGTLILTTSQNESPEERTTLLLITPDVGEVIEIPVTQSGILFSTDLNELSFSENPGKQTITLTTDMSWVATFDADWLTIDPVNGDEGGVLSFTVTRNRVNEQRSTTVQLTPEIGESIAIQLSQEASSYSSELIRFVAVHSVGSGNGESSDNAADFKDMTFWDKVNNELTSQSVEVIFLPGDYSRAYTDSGMHGLGLEKIGNAQHKLTMTGGHEVIFSVPEGHATTSNLIYFHGCQNIHFRDFNFTGNGAINYVLAIRTPSGWPASQNILIENCSWVDMRGVVYGATGCHYEGTTNITYKECTFKRVGVGSGSHMMYHAYGPTKIKVEECHFEDCMGDYVRFRDRTDYGIVKNSQFLRTATFPNVSFINIPCYNDVDPGDEFFGTNFSFTKNQFENQATEYTGSAILFRHRGFSPPGYNYLLTAEEGKIATSGSKEEKLTLIKTNFGIELEKVRVTENNYAVRINNQVSLYTATSYGSVSLGWQGTIVLTDLVNKSTTPFAWERSW